MTSTLYLIRGYAESRRIAATVYRDEGGLVSWSSAENHLDPLLARLFKRDFDEHLGFPARRFRARQGTTEAFDLAARYLVNTMAYSAIRSETDVKVVAQKPPRVSRAESLSVMGALEAVRGLYMEKVLREQMKARRDVFEYRQSEAIRFGSTFEFFRQHRARQRSDSQVSSTPVPSRSWYRLGAEPSLGGGIPARTDELSDGAFLSGSGPVQEVRGYANAA